MNEGVKSITMTTDGSCFGNPGAGGYCCILNYKGFEKIVVGGEASTTNNRMELTAVLKGFESLKETNLDIEIISDSTYVVKGTVS